MDGLPVLKGVRLNDKGINLALVRCHWCGVNKKEIPGMDSICLKCLAEVGMALGEMDRSYMYNKHRRR